MRLNPYANERFRIHMFLRRRPLKPRGAERILAIAAPVCCAAHRVRRTGPGRPRVQC
ncbi:hypothetical protein BDI4_1690013 [Burkholderia diffusa]|nr:hypothetical protein BDI4_1690013 [Burkholderia diffusa]